MAKSYSFELVSPEGVKVKCEIESLVLPGAAGSLGVLHSHEPWTVLLRDGVVEYRPAGEGWKKAGISGGVVLIEGTRSVILADSIRD